MDLQISKKDDETAGIKIDLEKITFISLQPKPNVNFTLTAGVGGVESGEHFSFSILVDDDPNGKFREISLEDLYNPEHIPETRVVSLRELLMSGDMMNYVDQCAEEAVLAESTFTVIRNTYPVVPEGAEEYIVPAGQIAFYLESKLYNTKAYVPIQNLEEYFDFD